MNSIKDDNILEELDYCKDSDYTCTPKNNKTCDNWSYKKLPCYQQCSNECNDQFSSSEAIQNFKNSNPDYYPEVFCKCLSILTK